MRKSISGLILFLLLTGCSEKLEVGHVVEKIHEPERIWLQIVPMKVGNVTIMQHFWHRDDEDFVLIIRGENSKGEIIHNRIYLPHITHWNEVRIGDKFVRNGMSVGGFKASYVDNVDRWKPTQEELDAAK